VFRALRGKNKGLNHEGHEEHEVKFDEISNKVKGIKKFVCNYSGKVIHHGEYIS